MKGLNTEDLIQRLAGTSRAVRPLSQPSRRAAAWLAGAILYVGVVVLASTPRGDLAAKLSDLRFVIEAATALATGIAAAIAAFTTVVPGYNRKALVVLMVPLAAWLGSVSLGCVRDWIALGPSGLTLSTDWSCFPAMLVTGALPTIAIAAMLRLGAPLTPTFTMALGGLAAAALADCGMRFHHHEAGVMVLVWHLGAVCVLLAASSRAGRYVLDWRTALFTRT